MPPYYLPRELPSVFITAVYIPPSANTLLALKVLYIQIYIILDFGSLNKQESAHPIVAFIVAGDFNKANLKNPTEISPVLCEASG